MGANRGPQTTLPGALNTDDCLQSSPASTASDAESLARSAGEPGGRQPAIRLGVCFGDVPGKRFLNVDYPFDGTPHGFDQAFELCRVAYHEAARATVRPCGFSGPWSQEASETLAGEGRVGL